MSDIATTSSEETAIAAHDDLGSNRDYGSVTQPSSIVYKHDRAGDIDDDNDDDDGASTDSAGTQDGVRQIEAVSMVWTKWSLMFAYFGIFLMSFTTSLEGQVTYSLSAFAVSSFKNHSLISAVYVVQGIVNAVIKPPMAKVADVFGRLEAFSVSILLYVLGYVQMAASRNVQTYASAQVFYSAGSTGLQILQQIFIADTSDLRNRALFSSLPDSPFLVTVWIGSTIASAILAATSWRWGYAIWAFILPVAFLPLGLSLLLNARKAKKLGLMGKDKSKNKITRKRRNWHRSHADSDPEVDAILGGNNNHSYTTHSIHNNNNNRKKSRTVRNLVRAAAKLCGDLDVVGMLLLSAAFALILLPLTLAQSIPAGWQNGSVVGMIAVGIAFLVAFLMWEARPELAPHPLVPLNLLRSRTFCAGCCIGFFYFMVFYLSIQPYFYSYLLVVHDQSVGAAGRITQTFSFSSTITNFVGSLLIRRAGRYKPIVVAGSCVYLSGAILLLYRTYAALPPPSFYSNNGNNINDIDGGSSPAPPPASVVTIALAQAVLGSGASFLHIPSQLAVQTAAGAHQQVAAATAVFMTLVAVGGACGAAVSGAVWSALLPSKLAAYLPPDALPDASAIYASVAAARSYPWGSAVRVAVNRAYAETVVSLLCVAVVGCLPILLLALMLEDRRLDGGGKQQLVHGGGEGVFEPPTMVVGGAGTGSSTTTSGAGAGKRPRWWSGRDRWNSNKGRKQVSVVSVNEREGEASEDDRLLGSESN